MKRDTKKVHHVWVARNLREDFDPENTSYFKTKSAAVKFSRGRQLIEQITIVLP